MELREKLQRFYHDHSKHANYQSIPAFVEAELGYSEQLNELWRSDKPRYRHLLTFLQQITFHSLVDVGANTGYFSLSLARQFPDAHIYAVEVNPNHVQFMKLILSHFHMTNVTVLARPLLRDNAEEIPPADVILLYNVLHHAGVDFDRGQIASPQAFAPYAQAYLAQLSPRYRYLVFQMGYNWGGNKKQPIIPVQDDFRKVMFTTHLLHRSGWKILKVAYPFRQTDRYEYRDMPSLFLQALQQQKEETIRAFLQQMNLENHSEFYRRPIFICESIHQQSGRKESIKKGSTIRPSTRKENSGEVKRN